MQTSTRPVVPSGLRSSFVPPAAKKTRKEIPKTKEDFLWTDSEVERLLRSIAHYKSQKIEELVDFDTVKEKYHDIVELFIEGYPEKSDFYPHEPTDFTNIRIMQKTKRIRQGYRKAVDTGRRSGGGRIVCDFFELCEDIWAGSPGTVPVEGGIESNVGTPTIVEIDDGDENDEPSTFSQPSTVGTIGPGPSEGRSAFYNKCAFKKMETKLSSEKMLFKLCQKEIDIKEKLSSQMESANAKNEDQISGLTNSINVLNETMSQGFTMLANLLTSQPAAPAPAPVQYFLQAPARTLQHPQ